MKKWTDYSIQTVEYDQKNYPRRIKEVGDVPRKLYYRGDLNNELLSNCVAIVGSRRMSRYGRSVAERFASDLVSHGVTVISGFMYGIDIVAHSTTVEEMGRTIAVIGGGIDNIYPADCEKLYTAILREKGVILSEFSPEQKPKPWMYAKRNRIVAALANLGVIVIEAGEKSGSLLTAEYAIKLRRPLYAVPGQINSETSKGTNWLIKSGKAKLITSVEDISGMNKLKINNFENKKMSSPLSPSKNVILDLLKTEGTPLAMDEIVHMTGLGVTEVSSQISLLHLQGLVDEINGKYAVKI